MSARREKVESIKVIKVTKVLQWELGLLSVVLVIPNRQKKDPCLGPGSESHIAGFTRTTALHYIGNFRLRKPPTPGKILDSHLYTTGSHPSDFHAFQACNCSVQKLSEM